MTPTPSATASAAAEQSGAVRRASVLIADKFEESGREALQGLGCEVHFDPDLTADTLPKALADHDPDIVIVRSTKVTEAAFAAATRLSPSPLPGARRSGSRR